jgi:hypothetical protein
MPTVWEPTDWVPTVSFHRLRIWNRTHTAGAYSLGANSLRAYNLSHRFGIWNRTHSIGAYDLGAYSLGAYSLVPPLWNLESRSLDCSLLFGGLQSKTVQYRSNDLGSGIALT